MSRTRPLRAFALYAILVAGCDDKGAAAPAVTVPPAVAPSRADREPASFTEDDRAVIAYLDAWEPLQRELRDRFVTVRKQATATRMDIARRRDTADPASACAAIAALLERNAAWHREHPLPAPLAVDKANGYASRLAARHTGKGDDLKALAARVSEFHDSRDDFDRRSTFQLNQQLDNLSCTRAG